VGTFDEVFTKKVHIELYQIRLLRHNQLGYPTKNDLKSWHREFEECRDLPESYACRKPTYSEHQKKEVVEHYFNHGRCIAATVKALGYPSRKTLNDWIIHNTS